MPSMQTTQISVSDLTLTNASGDQVPLASLDGVQLLVLMRHRH